MSVSLSLNPNISLDFIDKLVATKTPRNNDILVSNNPEKTLLSEEMLLSDSNQMPYANQGSLVLICFYILKRQMFLYICHPLNCLYMYNKSIYYCVQMLMRDFMIIKHLHLDYKRMIRVISEQSIY